MRNSIAFCAGRSQVSVAQAFSLCALACATAILVANGAPSGGSPAQLRTPPTVPKARPVSDGDIWLTDARAEYVLWRELQQADPANARAHIQRVTAEVQNDATRLPVSQGGAACSNPSSEACGRAMRHGMLVWRTLETVIDRERVDRSLAEFSKRFGGRRASVNDFRKICEQMSGRKLAWFFHYYLRGRDLPEITLRRIAGSAPNEVVGQIVVKNAPREFQVRVEMRLYTATGVINHSVATNGAVTPFTVTSNELVTRIALDPDARILRKLPTQP